jgi:hypothetical protein
VVSNLITAQVIRYVTDRVMENIARQASRSLQNGATAPSDVGSLALVAQLNQQLEKLNGRIDEVDERVSALNTRLGVAEKKTGWRYTLRLTLGVVVGIAIGAAAVSIAHLAHWVG